VPENTAMSEGIAHFSSRIRSLRLLLASLVFVVLASCAQDDVGVDLGADSTIQLTERSDEGSYRFREITMLALDGKATVFTIVDDVRDEAPMPMEVYEAMWSFAADRKVDSMEDAPLENAYPGQSTFEFSFRVGTESVEFTACGVDYLTDRRYRELAREIIAISEALFNEDDDGGPEPPVIE